MSASLSIMQSRGFTIFVVLFSSVMWAFWWYPVRLLEAQDVSGAWVGGIMSGSALILSCLVLPLARGSISSRAILGSLMIGIAVALYTISVSYTDFIRAVLIFYIAPTWSTLIEIGFFGRRWTARAGLAIICSFIGLLFISRGEISFAGIGAIGDWIALISGMAWSAGAALVFSSKQADPIKVLVVALIGAVGIAFALIALFGSAFGQAPRFDGMTPELASAMLTAGVYLATLLGCTVWGATRLEPTTLTYLFSVEVVAGVLVAAVLLGEQFGWPEFFGTVFILGAVLLELTRSEAKTPA